MQSEDRQAAKLATYRDVEYAKQYDRRWSSAKGARRDQRKRAALRRAWAIMVQYAGRPLRNALDVPSGTGRISDVLAELCSGAVLGADFSHSMLLEARQKHPDAAYCVADGARLPCVDKAFDVVVCIRFFHLVREPELRVAFLKEFARVARIGVIVDYRHRHTLRILGRRIRHRLGLRERAPSNPSRYQIRDEIERAGLHLAAIEPVRFVPFLSDKWLIVAIPNEGAGPSPSAE